MIEFLAIHDETEDEYAFEVGQFGDQTSLHEEIIDAIGVGGYSVYIDDYEINLTQAVAIGNLCRHDTEALYAALAVCGDDIDQAVIALEAGWTTFTSEQLVQDFLADQGVADCTIITEHLDWESAADDIATDSGMIQHDDLWYAWNT